MHDSPQPAPGTTITPAVAAFLPTAVPAGRFTEADDDNADRWAATVSVFELIADGSSLETAIDSFAATSTMSRSTIATAVKEEIATLGPIDVDSDNGRAAIELYLALMVESPEDLDDACDVNI